PPPRPDFALAGARAIPRARWKTPRRARPSRGAVPRYGGPAGRLQPDPQGGAGAERRRRAPPGAGGRRGPRPAPPRSRLAPTAGPRRRAAPPPHAPAASARLAAAFA